jgi:hemoglobin/transferrin/lactoferrin receptor protein
LGASALTLLPHIALAQDAGQTVADEARIAFDIPPQSLASAITAFGLRSGYQISVDQAALAGLRSPGVRGMHSPTDALRQLLAGTGLNWRLTQPRSVLLYAAPQAATDGTIQLGTLRVGGTTEGPRGNGRWDGTAASVYTTPGSVSAITKETLEAYPAQSPADMLRGATGIIAAEARTSGGLDVNIRGLQGQGRVPVTVDGAINGTTVYRGYQGTSNRSFVDPDFISHVAIVKGPSNSNAIAGGIGGSVSMTTLGVDDIVPEGEGYAIRVKASLSNNSRDPGSHMSRTLLEPASYYGDPLAATRERDRPGLLGIGGGSASIVLARKATAVDLIAGYSTRRTGNYFAGKQGKYAPRPTGTPSPFCATGTNEAVLKQLCERAVQFYDKHGATAFVGGEEVFNTSTRSESVLVKATIRPAEDHALELGYGGYWSVFGENYPGTLALVTNSVTQNAILSRTNLDRFTARYRWTPDSELIDLKLNGWLSKMRESAPSIYNSDPSRRRVDSWGVDLTNSSRLGAFSADYGASYLHEKAGPIGTWVNNGSIPPGREGTRGEYSLFADMALEPMPWLRLSAGGRYQRYKLEDRQSGTVFHSELLNRSEDAFNFSLGAMLTPIEGWQIFANYKQAARLPSLMEATTGFFMIANPDLHKEEARNWEFGTNYQRSGLFSNDDTLGAKLVWFDNNIDDYIARRFIVARGQMQMYNIDRAQLRGLEANLSYTIGGFSLDAGATWYDRVRFCRPGESCIASSLASDYGTNYIPPRWSANLSLNQKFLGDRAMVGARLTYMGKRAVGFEKPSTGYLPLISAIDWHPYMLVDLTGRFKLNDALSIDWSIDNLTDRYYNEAMSLGYIPAPGRTVRIGFTGTFGSKHALWSGSGGVAEPMDWTGPYVGADIGYGSGTTKGEVTNHAGAPADVVNGSRIDQNMRNFLGGLHAGYNYQLANGIVIGAEGGIAAGAINSWSGVVVSSTSGTSPSIASLQKANILESDTRYRWDRLITLRGKLGYAFGQTLIYGTAGVAWLRETQDRNQYRSKPPTSRSNLGIDAYSPGGEPLEHFFTERDRRIRTGGIVGAGVERAIGKQWSLRTEYSYAHFGKQGFVFEDARRGVGLPYTYTRTVRDPVTGAAIRLTDTGPGTSTTVDGRRVRSDANLHSVRLGISYHF